jgi:glucose-1-phosphatase
MNASVSIKVVLFDLGNVLVDLGDRSELNTMLNASGNEAEIWLKWLHSPLVKRFDSGLISFEEFAENMVEDVPSLGSVDEFKTRFSNWPKGLYCGALNLVKSVKPQYHRAILSNTNEAHWSRLMSEMKLAGAFQSYFASHQMGLVKPDKEIYLKVVSSLGVMPEEILFIDDNRVNVEAARNIGIIAHQAKGVNQSKAVLQQYHIV